jgi:hypothetical protein
MIKDILINHDFSLVSYNIFYINKIYNNINLNFGDEKRYFFDKLSFVELKYTLNLLYTHTNTHIRSHF